MGITSEGPPDRDVCCALLNDLLATFHVHDMSLMCGMSGVWHVE
jgi:hypothetical protein